MKSCSFVVGVEWKVRVLSFSESVEGEMVGSNSSVMGGGVLGGRSSRWTSARGKGFRPRPGTRTRVAPLLPSVVPTATPVSEEGEKCSGLPVGVMKVTGQPKGNKNLDSRSGATPVMISTGEVEFSKVGLVLGRQFAV